MFSRLRPRPPDEPGPRPWARGRGARQCLALGHAAACPYLLPTRRPHPPLVPPSPRRGRGENARVRRVSGPHSPSVLRRGWGIPPPGRTVARSPWARHRAPLPVPVLRRPTGSPLPATCCLPPGGRVPLPAPAPGRPPGRPYLLPAPGRPRGRPYLLPALLTSGPCPAGLFWRILKLCSPAREEIQ